MPIDRTQLAAMAQAVLEAMTFAMVEESDDLDLAETELLQAAVTFHGPRDGALELVMPESAARELAVNMLGLFDESELADQQRLDAVGELANVICGNVLGELAPDAVFDLDAPAVAPCPALPQPAEHAVTAELKLDCGWIKITLETPEKTSQTASP